MLRQQIATAQPAKSCQLNNVASFLDQIISPLYEVVAAVCFAILDGPFSIDNLVSDQSKKRNKYFRFCIAAQVYFWIDIVYHCNLVTSVISFIDWGGVQVFAFVALGTL